MSVEREGGVVVCGGVGESERGVGGLCVLRESVTRVDEVG